MRLHTFLTDTVRESALKVDSGRKIPCRTEESNLPQQRAGPTLYQLSYIPRGTESEKATEPTCFFTFNLAQDLHAVDAIVNGAVAEQVVMVERPQCLSVHPSVQHLVDVLRELRAHCHQPIAELRGVT